MPAHVKAALLGPSLTIPDQLAGALQPAQAKVGVNDPVLYG